MPQVIIAALLGGAALNAMVALTPGGAAFPVWTTSLALQGIVIAANASPIDLARQRRGAVTVYSGRNSSSGGCWLSASAL